MMASGCIFTAGVWLFMYTGCRLGEVLAQKLLGHSDITTTRQIYTHIRERQLENAAAQIENYLLTTSK